MEILGKHTNDTRERLENFDLKWNGLKQEVDTMKKESLNLKEQANKQKWIDSNRRKHNLVVFGLEESYKESKWDLCYALVDLFCNELHISMNENSIDDCYRVGRNSRRRPVLVSFVSTLMRDSILERAKILKGSGIFLERDYDRKTRDTRT